MSWDQVSLPAGWSLEVIREVDSTNLELQRRSEVSHGTVILAERQTAGRGRRGNEWHSVPGESLAFSVGLRPEASRSQWPRLALATGLAVAEALARLGLEAEVKWPNDVLVRGRKLCGVLVQATSEVAIIGIGVNVNQTGFEGEIRDTATSIYLEGLTDVSGVDLLGLILSELDGWTRQIGEDFPLLVGRLRQRCALTGKRVTLKAADGDHAGQVTGISDGGELMLMTEDGPRAFLQADEVRALG